MSDMEENPRETFLASQEILSTIEWADVLQDHTAASDAIALFETHIETLLEAMLKIKTKKFSRFLKDTVLIIARPIRALHRLREYIAAEPTTDIARRVKDDESTFEAFEEKVSSTVGNLIHRVVAQWEDHETFQLRLSPDLENELNNQHYLLVYLILLLLDRWVAPEELEAASTYFERTHPKYKRFSPRGPNAAPAPKKDTSATLRHAKAMMNDDSYDEEALLEDNYPLSETGITTLVSCMIYASANPQQLASTYTLPMVLKQDWLFTNAGGLASGFLTSDENQLAMADKALLVLQYTIDRTPLNGFNMEVLDYCTTDSSMDRMGLFQIFQVMVSFAATCPSANHRFFCFQALDRLVQACEDDLKMYLLEQLVSPKCPYESMRAAAINLVKGTVERAFMKLEQSRVENTERIRTGTQGPAGMNQIKSPFMSPLLLKTFVPSILRFDTKAFEHDPLKHEGAWQDKYDLFMHALNFYLFLLMRDKQDDNLTEVWLSSNIQDTHDEFVEPLTERVQELKEDYIQRLAEIEMGEDDMFDEEVGIPLHQVKSGNGVVNFDIDMESGDESNGDGDDLGKAKNGRPKDTSMDLNQKMMRLEIMDELLERVQELTGPMLRG
ncbi:hypothetical protein BGX31_010617 [Mortierella sp. GBA43]|nr:hypothetical protein BGX31_010617 [Mortierella sp. GBA43]